MKNILAVLAIGFLVLSCGKDNSSGLGGSTSFVLSGSSASVSSASVTTSPSAVNVKVYEIWVSSSATCTDALKVYSNTNPSAIDFAAAPTLANANIPAGTYNCVIMVVSDSFVASPATDLGHNPSTNKIICPSGTLVTQDICSTSSVITSPASLAADISKQPLESVTSQISTKVCADLTQIVPIYFSTGSTSYQTSIGSLYSAPTSSNTLNGLHLFNAFSVDVALAKATFTIDVNDRFTANLSGTYPTQTSSCTISTPNFSFIAN